MAFPENAVLVAVVKAQLRDRHKKGPRPLFARPEKGLLGLVLYHILFAGG